MSNKGEEVRRFWRNVWIGIGIYFLLFIISFLIFIDYIFPFFLVNIGIIAVLFIILSTTYNDAVIRDRRRAESRRREDAEGFSPRLSAYQSVAPGGVPTIIPGAVPKPVPAVNESKRMAVYNKLKEIDSTIEVIEKLRVVLEQDKDDKKIYDVIKQQDDIINYLVSYFDQYGAVYLEMVFRDEIQDLRKTASYRNMNFIDGIDAIHTRILAEESSLRNMGQSPAVQSLKRMDKAKQQIAVLLRDMKKEMAVWQTTQIIKNISPVTEGEQPAESALFSVSFDGLDEATDTLNSEYDRFISELEVL